LAILDTNIGFSKIAGLPAKTITLYIYSFISGRHFPGYCPDFLEISNNTFYYLKQNFVATLNTHAYCGMYMFRKAK